MDDAHSSSQAVVMVTFQRGLNLLTRLATIRSKFPMHGMKLNETAWSRISHVLRRSLTATTIHRTFVIHLHNWPLGRMVVLSAFEEKVTFLFEIHNFMGSLDHRKTLDQQ